MTVIHGRKWHTIHKTKCGKSLGKLPTREALAVAGTTEIQKVTCDDCKKAHKPGKV